MTPDDVLSFWLGAPAADADSFAKKLRRWFGVDKALDAEIRSRFGDDVQRARDGALDDWAATPGLVEAYALATKHAQTYLEQIRRFGRFPHRNAILGRTCTQEEMAFLDSPSTNG